MAVVIDKLVIECDYERLYFTIEIVIGLLYKYIYITYSLRHNYSIKGVL
jgi:hypothetical protein